MDVDAAAAVAIQDSEVVTEADVGAAARKVVVPAEEAHQDAHTVVAEVVVRVVVDVVRPAAAPDSPVHKSWGLLSVWHIRTFCYRLVETCAGPAAMLEYLVEEVHTPPAAGLCLTACMLVRLFQTTMAVCMQGLARSGS